MTPHTAQAVRHTPVPDRARASAAHFVFSAILAVTCAALVFLVCYPAPYGAMSGVSDVFLPMLAVDVVLGPLVTMVVFNTRKPRAELVRDLALVLVQPDAPCLVSRAVATHQAGRDNRAQ